MNSKRLKRKRIWLWHQDNKCFWCGTKTLLLEDKSKINKTRNNPNRATLDHLIYHGHVLRKAGCGNSYTNLVIACNKCNNERSVKESKLNNMRLKILKQDTKPSFCIL